MGKSKKHVTEDGEIIDLPVVENNPQVQLADEMLGNEYTPFFKTNYNHDTYQDAQKSALICVDDTLCQQHEAEETEINHILNKFGVSAVQRNQNGNFIEVPDDLDMASGIKTIRAGQEAFSRLPANVQQHFETIENYVDFVDQAVHRGDRQALQQFGLLPKDPQASASPAPSPSPTAPVKETNPPPKPVAEGKNGG